MCNRIYIYVIICHYTSSCSMRGETTSILFFTVLFEPSIVPGTQNITLIERVKRRGRKEGRNKL